MKTAEGAQQQVGAARVHARRRSIEVVARRQQGRHYYASIFRRNEQLTGCCRVISPKEHEERRVTSRARTTEARFSIIEKERWSVLKRSGRNARSWHESDSVRRRDRSRPIEGGEKREGRKKGSVGNERERSGREKNQRRGAACGENKIRSDRDTGGHRGGGEKRTKKRGRRTKRRRRRRREWGRQKEARVIGRRGRTSEGEHLPRTSYESRGGPPPRSCRRCSACGPKKIARKKERAGRRTTRIMNTYACRGGTSFTARHDREEIGPVKEDTPRDTIRARARLACRADVPAVATQRRSLSILRLLLLLLLRFFLGCTTPCVRTFPRLRLLARRGFAKFGLIFIPRHGVTLRSTSVVAGGIYCFELLRLL